MKHITMPEIFVENVLLSFNNITKKPEYFLSAPNNLIDKIHKLIKDVYDFTKSEEGTTNLDSLPELIVKNFDLEQIWQQIELQNNKLFKKSIDTVSKLVASKDRLWFLNIDDVDSDVDSRVSEDNNLKNVFFQNETNSESLDDKNLTDILNESDEQINSETEVTVEESVKSSINKKSPKQSIVDDDFFKLDEMEMFLKKEEQSETKDNSDDEESVDLFDNIESDNSEDETKINPRYNDFFCDSNNDNKLKNEQSSDEEIDELNNDEDNEDSEVISELKSTLELREERLQKKIGHIEAAALQEKSWHLKGEISASARPQNSLLEEVVEFDLTTRPAPIITQETTYKLEDVIKQRIKDKAWDSVERKAKPVEALTEFKKKLVLDQEKSKQSLAQIYESEFLKQKEALDPNAVDKSEEEPKEHIEIKSLMKKLFSMLDALSNFHFTPKTVLPELRVVNNLPAISMEEVAPIATNDAALLAPEEIKNKPKGDVIGRGERTDTDKKRERRQKKLKQKKHANEKQKSSKLAEQTNTKLNAKVSKAKSEKLMEKVTKDRNVQKMDESHSSKSVKSSTAFFTQLQEEIKGHIKTKEKRKSKEKAHVIAKKMKL